MVDQSSAGKVYGKDLKDMRDYGKADCKGSAVPAAEVRTGDRGGQAGDRGSDGYPEGESGQMRRDGGKSKFVRETSYEPPWNYTIGNR